MQIPASLRSDFIHIASERSIHIVGILEFLLDRFLLCLGPISRLLLQRCFGFRDFLQPALSTRQFRRQFVPSLAFAL